jgi:hypothetical protein
MIDSIDKLKEFLNVLDSPLCTVSKIAHEPEYNEQAHESIMNMMEIYNRYKHENPTVTGIVFASKSIFDTVKDIVGEHGSNETNNFMMGVPVYIYDESKYDFYLKPNEYAILYDTNEHKIHEWMTSPFKPTTDFVPYKPIEDIDNGFYMRSLFGLKSWNVEELAEIKQ